MRLAAITLGLCAVPAVALAQAPSHTLPAASYAPSPTDGPILQKGGGPPMIIVIEGIRGNRLITRQTGMMPVAKTRTRPVVETVTDENGQQRQMTKYVQETYTVMVPNTIKVEFPMAGVQAFDTNGRPITPDQLVRLYPRSGLALMAMPGMPVDPAYLKIARDGVPLVALPRPVPGEPVKMPSDGNPVGLSPNAPLAAPLAPAPSAPLPPPTPAPGPQKGVPVDGPDAAISPPPVEAPAP